MCVRDRDDEQLRRTRRYGGLEITVGSRNRDEQGPLDPRRVGAVAHELIAGLLRDGVRDPDPGTLLSYVSRHELTSQDATVYRQAMRQRTASAVASYFRLFAPPATWTFTGSEIALPGGCRLDLVWETPDGIVADELKVGRVATGRQRGQAGDQLARYLAAGQESWGARFVGVRWLMLGAPAVSFLARPDGVREVLAWR